MSRMLPLVHVTLQHAYFNGAVCPPWRFEPLAGSEQIERSLGLRRQAQAGGFALWREINLERAAVLAGVAGENQLRLQYAVFCDEPDFSAVTVWPAAPPVCYRLQWDGKVVQTEALAVSEIPELAASVAAKRAIGLLQPWFMLEIVMPEVLIWQSGTESGRCHIEMDAPALHWKYFFGGALAQKKLTIVDLEAGLQQAAEIRFVPSQQAASAEGAAFVSDQAIMLQQVPTRRFQLQEADMVAGGQGGRVLIKRLPNASVKKIGKETGSDGKDMLVAEIYIHQ